MTRSGRTRSIQAILIELSKYERLTINQLAERLATDPRAVRMALLDAAAARFVDVDSSYRESHG